MRKPSAPLIISLVALFVSLGGTSLAAQHYLLTSTSQVKPNVLRALRGPPGPQGATGIRGTTGAAGAPADLSNLCSGLSQARLEISISEPDYESLTQKALTTIYNEAC